MKRRTVRLSAAALLLGAAATAMMPHMTSYVSSSAMVTAPLLAVRAPFDGVLAQSSASAAQPVQAGEHLLRLEVLQDDQDVLAAVRAEIDSIRAERSALATQIEAIAQVEAVAQEPGGIADRVTLGYGTVHRAPAAEDRELELFPEKPFMAVIPALAFAQEPGFNGQINGGPDARQRPQELVLQKAALAARQTSLSGRLAALEAQEAALSASPAPRNTFTPASDVAGVIWHTAPAEGATVAAGETLMEVLDCSNRFVQVALSGRHFERIRVGDTSTVQLKGAGTRLEATVEVVRGTGASFADSGLAPTLTEIQPGDIEVLVRLDPADPTEPGVAASFCDVGRTAEVRFAREITPAIGQLTATMVGIGGWAKGLLARANSPDLVPEAETALLEDAS